jgi:hypothetical protein
VLEDSYEIGGTVNRYDYLIDGMVLKNSTFFPALGFLLGSKLDQQIYR